MPKTNILKTTIQIYITTQTMLIEQGRMHESYDDVIQRLIKELIELRKKGER